MVCLNLCDILNEKTANEKIFSDLLKIKNGTNRLYVGSYFCSQYFLKIIWTDRLIEFCNKNNLKITLVVPVVTEKDLKISKILIHKMIEIGKSVLDEVTVNDLGMLNYIAKTYTNLKINLGRLFFKDAREVRIAEYSNMRVNISKNLTSYLMEYKINCVELDEITMCLDFDNKDRMVSIHRPFCFVTTGNICKYASLHKTPDKKFRPNDKCVMECQHLYEHYNELTEEGIDLYRIGRAVYSYKARSSELNAVVDREIYFPFLELNSMLELEGIL